MTVATVSAEAYRRGCPYHLSAVDVQAAIDAERGDWSTYETKLPIPEAWILERAAQRLWDDGRLPFVFIRAEWHDQQRSLTPGRCRDGVA